MFDGHAGIAVILWVCHVGSEQATSRGERANAYTTGITLLDLDLIGIDTHRDLYVVSHVTRPIMRLSQYVARHKFRRRSQCNYVFANTLHVRSAICPHDDLSKPVHVAYIVVVLVRLIYLHIAIYPGAGFQLDRELMYGGKLTQQADGKIFTGEAVVSDISAPVPVLLCHKSLSD